MPTKKPISTSGKDAVPPHKYISKNNFFTETAGSILSGTNWFQQTLEVLCSLHDMVIMYNIDGKCVKALNGKMKFPETFNLEAPGKNIEQLFPGIPASVSHFFIANDLSGHFEWECAIEMNNETIFTYNKLLRVSSPDHTYSVFLQCIENITCKKKKSETIEKELHQLRRSYHEFCEIIDNATEIIFKVDLQGHFFFISTEFERTLGYRKEDILGKHFSSVVHPDDLSICADTFTYITRFGKSTNNILFRLIHVEGHFRWFSCSGIFLFDEQHQPLHCIGFAQDVTDLQEAIFSIKASEERYSTFFTHSSEAIWRFELDKPLHISMPADEMIDCFADHAFLAECNIQMANSYGWDDPAKIVGTPLKSFLPLDHPDNRKYLKKFIHSGFKTDGMETVEKDKDGNKKYFLNNLHGIVQNDHLLRVWGTQVDITHQREAEEKIRYLAKVLENVSDAIISTDLQFNVIAWNKAAEEIYAIRAEQAIGMPIRDIVQHNYISCTREEALASLLKNDNWEGEVYVDLKDGRRRHMLLSMSFVKNENGERLGFAGIHKDITERKEQDKILSLEKAVLEINADPRATLKFTVDYFLEQLEKIFSGMHCAVLIINEDGKNLKAFSAPSLTAEFSADVKNVTIGPKASSSGTAIYLKRPVISPDINNDPLWEDYLPYAKKLNLRSCWSFPIFNSNKEVIAAIAAYHNYPKTPTQKELNIFERKSKLLGIIIANKQAEEKMKISNERYLLATKVTNDAIWDWDIPNNLFYWGEAFHTLFGYKPGGIESRYEFWESKIHPEDRERVVDGLQDFVKSRHKHKWEEEYRFLNAEGKYLFVSDRGFLLFNQEKEITRMVGSMQDVSEKREMQSRLLKQEVEKQKMVAQAVVDAQEKERAEIGKELHDNVNQILSTARMYLELAKTDEKERMELLRRSTEAIYNAINEIRGISRSLVPPSIGDLGLIESIVDLVESVKFTRILNVEFYHQGELDQLLNEKQKLMIFRIIQEQVNNVLKHAEAKNLIIELELDEASIHLTVSDDGKGFDKCNIKNKKGVGLSSIQSRTELFNGSVKMVTSPGKGCTMHIYLPISKF